ncbi:MAG: histidine phosphatase family protein [Mariprofundaceae bacterium]|nr:histidine phosphatase family protein [Mariprofundaceae bacterium]
MLKPVLIDLLRHGEVEGRQHVARGSTDNPLSPLGWQQLMQVKANIGTVDAIATSPLKRCRLFAESCDEPVDIFEDMRELDFGDWENKSNDEVVEQALLQQFFDDPTDFQAPNGELFEDFTQRVIQAWEHWLQTGMGEHRLLMAHGCVIRVILAHLLGIPTSHIWRLSLDYASWSRVSCMQREQPRVLFINRHAGQV